jgi:hypothetical protein
MSKDKKTVNLTGVRRAAKAKAGKNRKPGNGKVRQSFKVTNIVDGKSLTFMEERVVDIRTTPEQRAEGRYWADIRKRFAYVNA